MLPKSHLLTYIQTSFYSSMLATPNSTTPTCILKQKLKYFTCTGMLYFFLLWNTDCGYISLVYRIKLIATSSSSTTMSDDTRRREYHLKKNTGWNIWQCKYICKICLVSIKIIVGQGKFHLMMEIHDDSVYISKICLISQKITAQEKATFV